ncbi:MAG: D-alanyl-D-alanine carboxypeptidase [Firmicutes bacterium]|nr:D-alanyl-D-alanine carboxypeptidase [Bacillota bacterium]
MKKYRHPFFRIVLILCLFLSLPGTAAQAQSTDPLRLQVEAAILVDGNSGKILYEKNAEQPLALASMTKILTEYLILEQIKEKKLTWEQTTTISDYAYRISQNLQLSNVPLRAGQAYTVRELYEAVAIYSANGATIALAELVAGSETEFVRLMNEKAQAFGMRNCKFVNSTGLNNKDLLGLHPAGDAQQENFASAKDTAIMAFRLIKDFPEALTIASTPRKIFRAGTSDAIRMDNWNWMLPELVYGYEGIDGLKTGSTNLAGYCFTATGERNGTRLISVVMKGRSYAARFQETKKLLDYGFNNYETKELFPRGYQAPETMEIPVQKGRETRVPIATGEPLTILVRRGQESRYQPVVQLDRPKIIAPVAEGAPVGNLTARYEGEQAEYLTPDGPSFEEVPLVTTQEVKKAGFFRLIYYQIIAFFSWLGRKIGGLFS